MGLRVPVTAVILAAGLLVPGSAAGQSSEPAASPDLARVKHRLETPTPLLDWTVNTQLPTFRVSVSEKAFDIWTFWGDPEALAREIRPRFGPWHQEFQKMVTPDDFQGLGPGMGNGERAQLAATSFAFAYAMKVLKNRLEGRGPRKAKEEVQRELEAFYALHPEARPAPAETTPP
jgi:hypothetical protein